MENKKTFGAYICRRRKELGMTQREFADRLYVTESAVSKWERGLSYPDITLLRDICAVLDISERELLTASEDTEKRTAEKLAAKYLRLTRTYRLVLYILFGGTLLGCAIGNLAAQHTLSWVWIVLAGVLLAASLTLAPSLADMHPVLERHKWAFSIGCAAIFLELLLLFCCLYTGGDWFPVACIGTLFGLSLVLLPVLLPTLPLPPALARRKTSFYLVLETVLLLLLLLISCLYTGGNWFLMAAVGVVFGLSLFFTPVFLCQLPLPAPLSRCKAALYIGIETVLLLVLLLTGCLLYSESFWFPLAATGTLFGLGLVLLPIPLCQLPLPEEIKHHKTLLYFAIETLLLIFLLGAAEWYSGGGWLFTQGLPIALLGLTLPWGLMGIIRYLPVNGWFRTSLSCVWTGLWAWLTPWMMDRIMILNGWTTNQPYRLRIPFDFSRWGAYVVQADDGWEYISYGMVANNIHVLILLGLGLLTVIFAAAGIWHSSKKRKFPR